MSLTLEKLESIFPRTKDVNEWFNILTAALPEYEIDSDLRIASFLAQCGHESADFNTLIENLNYSSDSLRKVFPKYFPTATSAEPFNRHAEDIANKIYGNRMGNTEEGDGWLYRGRGVIQITGKDNYAECSQFLFGDDLLVENPDYLLTKDGAIRSACWFWVSRKLNELADRQENATISKRVNGGNNGMSDRIARFAKIVPILRD